MKPDFCYSLDLILIPEQKGGWLLQKRGGRRSELNGEVLQSSVSGNAEARLVWLQTLSPSSCWVPTRLTEVPVVSGVTWLHVVERVSRESFG